MKIFEFKNNEFLKIIFKFNYFLKFYFPTGFLISKEFLIFNNNASSKKKSL